MRRAKHLTLTRKLAFSCKQLALAITITCSFSPAAYSSTDSDQTTFAPKESSAVELKQLLDTTSQLLNAGEPGSAIGMLLNASKKFPQSALIHFQLGNAQSDLHNYSSAIKEYDQALKLQPDLAVAILNMAYANVNAHQFDQAMPWFKRYIEENPTADNLPEVKSQMFAAQSAKASSEHKFLDAKQSMETAVQANPNSSTMHFKLASACEVLDDSKRAIDEYQIALQINPTYSAAAFNIAGCYQNIGRPLEAIDWFQNYLKLEPKAKDRSAVKKMIEKLQNTLAENQVDPHTDDYVDSAMENGKFYRWSKQSLPLKVYIGDGSALGEFIQNFRNDLTDSFDQWATASQKRITFSFVQKAEQADIVCYWTTSFSDVRQDKNSKSDLDANVEQGVCFMQAAPNRHSEVATIAKATLRICVLDRETLKPLSDDDMKKTCLHEIGHALGLRGHSSNNHDIMFYSVSPSVWPVLSKRDKATLLHLYEGYPTQRAALAAPYQ